MEKRYYAESELIINVDGTIFHLHLKPEQLADKIILVGDPSRVSLVASHFDSRECEVENREFKTIRIPPVRNCTCRYLWWLAGKHSAWSTCMYREVYRL